MRAGSGCLAFCSGTKSLRVRSGMWTRQCVRVSASFVDPRLFALAPWTPGVFRSARRRCTAAAWSASRSRPGFFDATLTVDSRGQRDSE
ncbi:unnamed protein product, partial [Ectocarpus sp. 12 AP-2014]